ncbi:MAG TPA: right-handed parallel beta-helix repeat-containing protein [Candidatus Binataceae bacterium]|nr:right-handed parallel beta-helix repeat-containing protein [Candidatus Binataceae bacterium]
MSISTSRLSRWVVALPVAASLAFSSSVGGAVTFKPIKKCGTISTAGYYKVTKTLTFQGSGACLVIAADNVTLNIDGHSLKSSGGGTGISITGANAFVDFNDGTVTGFAIGIEDDGSGAVVQNFTSNNNTDTGIYVNGASGSTFGGFGANNNTNHGIHLRRANNNILHNMALKDNGSFGLWAELSSNNVINNFVANNNGIAGVYFGCSSSGPAGGGPACAGANSGSNVVTSTGDDNNGFYGLAIDLDSEANVIDGAEQSNNNGADDSYDANTNCGTNLWFNETHGTTNQPCTRE